MPGVIAGCCLLLLLAFAMLSGAQAQTLRWAARGDSQGMDPYAFAEGVTHNLNSLVYDSLVEHDQQQRIVPALATAWSVSSDGKTWRFTLRRGVSFHDGTPFSADDVVFSILRAQRPPSARATLATRLGTPVRVDAQTVELRLRDPNPAQLEMLGSMLIMGRDWTVAHGAERVADAGKREESPIARQAMGTGRFMLSSREPGVRTVLTRNPKWWGRFEGNVERLVFLPIDNDATRTAALIAGDLDFTQDLSTQDVPVLAMNPAIRLLTGPESRVIYLGLDQFRDELPDSGVMGRNPLKDRRVREALFDALDAERLRTTVMRGLSVPTACMASAETDCLQTELAARPPADLERARALLAQAGYAQGFALVLDCPNDRYVNDRALCVAIAGMLSRVGVRVTVQARSKTQHFPKLRRYESSFFLAGWGGVDDPQFLLDSVLHSVDPVRQKGDANYARYADLELDRLIDTAGVEMDAPRRAELIRAVQRRVFEQHYYLPLHRQAITWAARKNVRAVITPNNVVRPDWIHID